MNPPTANEKAAVACRRDGRVAYLELARPEIHNAFDDQLVAELTAALEGLAGDERVTAVVLTGRGQTFSAGADLNWMRRMAEAGKAENQADAQKLAALLRILNYFPRPTIARVNGSAYGGGVGLVACCDIAIGVEHAKFALSEVRLGLVPAVIAPYVLAAIGGRQARRYFVSGEVFDAKTALRLELLHECVPAADLDAAVGRVLHWLVKGGPQAQREAKRLALRCAGRQPAESLKQDQEHAALIARLRAAPEAQSGIAAFLAQKPPPWAPPPEDGAADV